MKIKMKYVQYIIMGFIALLCGCGESQDAGKDISASMAPSMIPSDTMAPSPTMTPTPTLTPSPTPTPTPVPAWKVNGAKDETMSETYHIDNEAFIYANAVLTMGDRLLILGKKDTGEEISEYHPEYELVLYDCETNSILAGRTIEENGFGDYSEFGQINDSMFYLYYYEDEHYDIYNDAMEEVASFSLPDDNSYQGCFSGDGRTLYFSKRGGSLYRWQMGCEPEQIYENKEWEDPYIQNLLCNDRYAEVHYYSLSDEGFDSHTAYFDLQTMEPVRDLVGSYEAKISPDGEYCLLQMTNFGSKLLVYRISDEELISDIQVSYWDEVFRYDVDWEQGYCLTQMYYPTTGYNMMLGLRAYDLQTGQLAKEIVVGNEGACYNLNGGSFRNAGMYAYYVREDDTCRLTIWDYSRSSTQDASFVFSRYGQKQKEFSEELLEYRDALEQEFGINLYIGNEISESSFSYECEIILEEKRVRNALECLAETLAMYPDGFFEQMKQERMRSLGIYLAGTLKGKDSYGLEYAGGFADENGYERSLVLDINVLWGLSGTIVHEVAHWIQSYIQVCEGLSGTWSFMSGFEALNPVGFCYRYDYDYLEPKKEMKKYICGYGKSEDIYFIDSYCTTFLIEDQARCFEYMMTDIWGDYKTYPHIRKKMEYWCEQLRVYFDSTGWPEKTSWEIALEENTPETENE